MLFNNGCFFRKVISTEGKSPYCTDLTRNLHLVQNSPKTSHENFNYHCSIYWLTAKARKLGLCRSLLEKYFSINLHSCVIRKRALNCAHLVEKARRIMHMQYKWTMVEVLMLATFPLYRLYGPSQTYCNFVPFWNKRISWCVSTNSWHVILQSTTRDVVKLGYVLGTPRLDIDMHKYLFDPIYQPLQSIQPCRCSSKAEGPANRYRK